MFMFRKRNCSTGVTNQCGTEDETTYTKCDEHICKGTKPNMFGVCTFDDDTICTWTQSNQDSFDWSLQSGPTLTDGTGPNNDHTLQTAQGKYLFIETSAPRLAGEQASIVSPELPSDHTVCLEFWNYMFGDGIGSLQVHAEDTYSKNVIQLFKEDGDHGERWIKASVTIFSNQILNNYRLVITANVGSTYKGDTAIDDLALLGGACADSMLLSTHTPAAITGTTTALTSTALITSTFVSTTGAHTTRIPITSPKRAGQWSEWFNGKCSATCGIGTQHRLRICNTVDCAGPSSDSIPCNDKNCTTQGFWTEWFSGKCSKTCGEGTMQRIRQCTTGSYTDCTGSQADDVPCKLADCPASWSEWSYSACSKTCGGGHLQKVRNCSTGDVMDCLGIPLEIESCNVHVCPG